jgi:hypothetical protein
MVTRAGFLFLSVMFGAAAAAALLGGMPMGPILLLAVTVLSVSMLLPNDQSGRRHRFRMGDEVETPRGIRGDCRDSMGHTEPPVQPRDDVG